jgi:hypothetical protein
MADLGNANFPAESPDLAQLLAEMKAAGLHEAPQPRMATSWQDLAGFAGPNTGMLGYSPGGAAGPGNLPSLQNPPIPTPAQMGFRPPAMPSTGGAMPNPAERADIRESANAAAGLGDVGSLFVGGPVGRGLNYGLGLMDILGGQAQAGEPDPRVGRITRLNADIKNREATLKSYATKNFPSTVARNAANKVELDAIGSARAEVERLQGALDQEAADAADRERAAQAAAKWADTPFAKRYPGAPAGLAGLGAIGSLAFPIMRGRRAVTAFERDAQSISQRVKEAAERANDTSLPAKVRTQTANEARQLQDQYDTLRGAGPATGGHARAFFEGAVPFEIGLAAPSIIDYLNSTPGSELRSYTLHSNSPVENPGEVSARYGLGLGFGGALGELGHILGDRLANPGTDYGAEVRALNKRYSEPRAKAPRARRR